jgi:hypothetical protein
VKRLLKLLVIAGVIGGLVAVARKLMGGLGPQPGAADAPKEWPSLVPEPPAPEAAPRAAEAASGNGSGAREPGATGGPGAVTDAEATPGGIASTGDSGINS